MAFGWARWGEWVASLPAFGRIVEATPSLGSAVITPAWAARMLGLSGPVGVIWIAGFALGGAWLVWRVFRSHACAAARAGVLAAASLMATPYAMS